MSEFPRWTVDLCDDNFRRLHEVSAGSFTGVSRLNQAGRWRVDMLLDEIRFEIIPDVSTVLVRDETSIKYAGIVSRLSESSGGAVRTVSGTERRLVFEGADLWGLLAARVVFPDPTTFDMSSQAFDVQAGVASSVAAHFIQVNAGSTALVERRFDGLSVSNPVVGGSATWSGRLQPLDVFVGQICDQGDISCEADLDSQLDPRFTFREPVDRTNSVVFSDKGDLADFSQSWVPAGASWVLAAGQGEGTSRDFEAAGTPSGRARVERVTEQSNATTTAQLAAIAEAVRRDGGAVTTIQGAISEQTARQFPANESYRLGDLVGFNIGVDRIPVKVTSITTEVSAARSIQLPVFGVWTPDRLQGLRRDVLGLADRFNTQVR